MQEGTAGLASLQERREICGVVSIVKLQAESMTLRWVPGALAANALPSGEDFKR